MLMLIGTIFLWIGIILVWGSWIFSKDWVTLKIAGFVLVAAIPFAILAIKTWGK